MKPLFLPRWFFALCLLTMTQPVFADSDHDRVRKAVQAGEIMPLEQVLQQVQKVSPGKVLEVELEREGGIWLYEIKLLRDNGSLSKQYFDARNGALLGTKERHRYKHKHRDDDDEDDD